MNRRYQTWLWVFLVFLLALAWGCEARVTPADPTANEAGFNEVTFWESLPRPDDAKGVEVGEGFDLGFVTQMIEPELFDLYAAYLREQGWRRQAPTEAMVTLPHQTWRKDGVELLIEIQGLDEEGRTIVWLRMDKQ
jgi:hypothetical protein